MPDCFVGRKMHMETFAIYCEALLIVWIQDVSPQSSQPSMMQDKLAQSLLHEHAIIAPAKCSI